MATNQPTVGRYAPRSINMAATQPPPSEQYKYLFTMMALARTHMIDKATLTFDERGITLHVYGVNDEDRGMVDPSYHDDIFIPYERFHNLPVDLSNPLAVADHVANALLAIVSEDTTIYGKTMHP